jgi:diaminohydroxyphosphoribosylaminopyrimidine deaminase/5-amino-6-(5-phosphoribosylamino)uracil reductase
MENEKYMQRAIELAKKGIGFVNPNPLVGAVIVKDGEIIGEGYHEKYGQLHAERNALKNAKKSPVGAEMYVTLEPCCHYGKNPPCTDAVIASGIKKVYVGSDDPNPLVAGKGIQILREHGIEVVTHFMKEECDKLNDIFFHYIMTKTPYCILKYAMTADGKLATKTGESKWISNEKSRKHTHFTRKRVSAILVGIDTVLKDNPILSCRCENPSNPLRIVCDSNLRILNDCNLVKTAKEIPLLVATLSDDETKIKNLESFGVKVYRAEEKDGHIDLKNLMKYLGSCAIDSVIIEGGAEIHWSALKEGIVNKVQVYIGAEIFGSKLAKSPVGGEGIELPCDAIKLKNPHIELFDDDVLIEYDV